MGVPGFSSEASLYRSACSYRSEAALRSGLAGVQPAGPSINCCPVGCGGGVKGICCCPRGSRCSGSCVNGAIRCQCQGARRS